MKKRIGLVSNSSTSSFICAICGGEEAAGHDASWEDMGVDYVYCDRHKMHGQCLGYEDKNGSSTYLKEANCPICQMQLISKSDRAKYLIKKAGGQEVVDQEIKDSFKSYQEFRDFLREKKG